MTFGLTASKKGICFLRQRCPYAMECLPGPYSLFIPQILCLNYVPPSGAPGLLVSNRKFHNSKVISGCLKLGLEGELLGWESKALLQFCEGGRIKIPRDMYSEATQASINAVQ